VPQPLSAPDAALTLLACTDGEYHTLPLVALAAALAERRLPTRMLGAATPALSIVRATREVRPDAVIVWSQHPRTASLDLLRALGAYPVRRIVAGPGWAGQRLPGVARVASLGEALAAVAGPQIAPS
jgi:hypothetical protein